MQPSTYLSFMVYKFAAGSVDAIAMSDFLEALEKTSTETSFIQATISDILNTECTVDQLSACRRLRFTTDNDLKLTYTLEQFQSSQVANFLRTLESVQQSVRDLDNSAWILCSNLGGFQGLFNRIAVALCSRPISSSFSLCTMIFWNPTVVLIVASAILAGAEAQGFQSKSFFAFGGSVRWRNSNASVKDFVSQLRVYIYSLPDETLRQVVHVLPNGAYSVVVSDSGRYRIRLSAPQGWNYLPANGFEVDLNDSMQNDQMNYIFDLTGFDVSGQVVTTGMTTGPPDLIVSVISDGTIFSQSKTTANGSFTISSVPPGKYVVTVGDSTSGSGANNARASSSITISTSSLKLADPLVLQGHSLYSAVTFNGQGVANIPILLFIPKSSKLTESDLNKFGCFKPSKPPVNFIPANLKDLLNPDLACQVISNADGAFVFSRLAGGEYFLVAYHDPDLMKSSEIRSKHLNISPTFLSVTMEHVDRQLDPGFQVTSFRIGRGCVKQPSGVPIANAEVFVNGNPVTRTNVKGEFEFDLTASGEYLLHVKAPRVKFEEVKLKLTPTTGTLPNFVPNEVEFCGRFLMTSSLKPGTLVPRVEIVSGPSIEATISSDAESAEFCIYLSPKKHTLRLIESHNSILFSPTSINIDLSSGPVEDAIFTQFQAVLIGEVLCIDRCPVSQLAARLSSKEQFDIPSIVANVEVDQNNSQRGTFTFESVSPGLYDLELAVLDGDAMKPASGWCWAPPGLLRSVTVTDHDLHSTPELSFQQTGYRLHVDVPVLNFGFKKPINLKVTPSFVANGSLVYAKSSFYLLTRPLTTICLSGGSSFTFEASAPCLHLETPSPSMIRLADTDIPLTAPPKTVSISVREIPVSAVVRALPGIESFGAQKYLPELTFQANVSNSVKRISTIWRKEGGFYTSRMSLWAAPDEEIVFTVSPSKPSSDQFTVHPLIVPAFQTLHVPPIIHHSSQSMYEHPELEATSAPLLELNETDCDVMLGDAFGGIEGLTATFSMKLGFFFNGVVQPPVDKALVAVYADTSVVSPPPPEAFIDVSTFSEHRLNAPSLRPGFALVMRTLTNAQGLFHIGPFYFDRESAHTAQPSSLLTIQLHKPGFEFSPKSSADWLAFSSHKLALVEVHVVSEGNMKPLPNTLVSIIGNVFRDSKTADSDGVVRYIGLPPGEYYIQPILKEYEFFVRKGTEGNLEAPMEHALRVVGDESMSVNLVGRRIAYSTFGEVTSLSGHPEVGVIVEAKLLSSKEMKAFEGRSIFPAQSSDADVPCLGHTYDAGFVVPVEQAITDHDGKFKLLGLLPGCPYLVTATRRENESALQIRHIFPPFVIVKPLSADVYDLRFYLKPRVSLGMISATVDTDVEYLPELSIVIRANSHPEKPVLRHNFASQSRFFALLGDQVESLIGDAYQILLESNSAHIPAYNRTIQKFNFVVNEKYFEKHQHFNFAYRPSLPPSRT
ncbi:Nodal modulator 2 [Taenia crassiceps]|uniref:Nodal modulator 2 n=1 Tax=Taenia crassiceps TaxID=6207 RepID=A0ABR4Q6Z6_9CEST